MATPVASPADEGVARERARARRILILSALLALLVMGAVVALGLDAANRSPQGAQALAPRDYSYRDIYGANRDSTSATPVDDGCPVDADHPPRMVFELPPSGLDFGDVKQGVVLEKEVSFRNEGTGALCIRRVESGCGCIKARLASEQRRFEPGETGRLLIVLDTKGKEGVQKKTIRLYTNAVDVPVQNFTVRAGITLGLRVAPTFLNLGRVTAGRPAEGLVRFRAPKADGEWTVTDVVGTTPLDGAVTKYEWTVTPVEDAADRILDVRVRHPGIAKTGTAFQDALSIRTTHPDRPEYTLRTYLLVVEPILAVPQRALLGNVPSAEEARIQLMRGDDQVRFRVTGFHFESADGAQVEPDAAGFLVAWTHDEKSGDTIVTVRYDGRPRPPGPLKAVLVLHTDEPRLAEVRVECSAMVL